MEMSVQFDRIPLGPGYVFGSEGEWTPESGLDAVGDEKSLLLLSGIEARFCSRQVCSHCSEWATPDPKCMNWSMFEGVSLLESNWILAPAPRDRRFRWWKNFFVRKFAHSRYGAPSEMFQTDDREMRSCMPSHASVSSSIKDVEDFY
jgi:hypothetical protein